jgi:hypothetical protein
MRSSLPLIVTLLSLCSACSAGNGPLYLSSVRSSVPGPGACTAAKDPVTSIGLLDVAADPEVEVTAFITGMADFYNPEAQPRVITGSQQLAPASRERLLVQRVLLRYSSKPAIPGLTASITDTVARTLALPPASPLEVPIQVPLFGPNVLKKLQALQASNTDSFAFTSTFEIQGVTQPSGAEFSTPPFSMPMTLVKTEVTCSTVNDQRLKRFSSATPQIRACSFIGLNKRFGPGDCCLTVDAMGNPALDLTQPGCDVLP